MIVDNDFGDEFDDDYEDDFEIGALAAASSGKQKKNDEELIEPALNTD